MKVQSQTTCVRAVVDGSSRSATATSTNAGDAETYPPSQSSPAKPHQPSRARIEQQQHNEENRIKTFGQIRPIIYVPNFNDERLIAVREKLYQAPVQSTFTNFLFHHGLAVLGDEWLETQTNLPASSNIPFLFCTARPSIL